MILKLLGGNLMNKAELVANMAAKCELTKKETECKKQSPISSKTSENKRKQSFLKHLFHFFLSLQKSNAKLMVFFSFVNFSITFVALQHIINYDNPQYVLSKSQSFVVYLMLKISDVTDSGRQ